MAPAPHFTCAGLSRLRHPPRWVSRTQASWLERRSDNSWPLPPTFTVVSPPQASGLAQRIVSLRRSRLWLAREGCGMVAERDSAPGSRTGLISISQLYTSPRPLCSDPEDNVVGTVLQSGFEMCHAGDLTRATPRVH
jgi:hypothetical protein